MSRTCTRVRVLLPAHAAGGLPRVRRWAVASHLRRCSACREELAREELVVSGLAELGSPTATAPGDPPGELLDDLLARAAAPNLRERLAVPARGAVSGARPALSVALLVVGAGVGTAVGWATLRGGRAVRRRLGRGGGR